jgi:hypothetical protein
VEQQRGLKRLVKDSIVSPVAIINALGFQLHGRILGWLLRQEKTHSRLYEITTGPQFIESEYFKPYQCESHQENLHARKE